jgi:hypothetical protein
VLAQRLEELLAATVRSAIVDRDPERRVELACERLEICDAPRDVVRRESRRRR